MTGNFFDYFPVAPKVRSWGLHATSFGHVRVPPQTAYPPDRHPEGRHFAWDQGRTLREFQLTYIQDGQGIFESALTRPRKITGGSVFLLFPGVWHRYRPTASAGWTEWWIGLNGSYLNRLRRGGIIDPKRPVHRLREIDELESFLEKAQQLALAKPAGCSVRLGLLAVQILPLLLWSSGARHSVPRRMERIVSRSQTLLARESPQSASIEETARQLGVGYSYFRREFRQQTGLSPKQYQIEIRHRRTKDLLRGTRLTIKEIAERLAYHSPYHLSLDFSKRAGLSPTKWRRGRQQRPA
jgi:AraC-like DNA-binding protein